jgi:transglutaminase-like putative cysteine protease
LPNVTAADLRAAGDAYPSWVEDYYLQLPDELPGRVHQLAEEVTAGTETPYDAAVAIENYLRQPIYTFSRDVPDVPQGNDTVDHFLFESKTGFFDYYASAMTVLLRSLGIPSRLAVGFVLEEQDPVDNSYTVRDRHAYAWSEAYFPGVGWVQFNPSPDRAALGGATIPEEAQASGTTETFDDVLPTEDLIEEPEFPEAAPVSDLQTDGGTPLGVWIALAVLSALAVAVAAGYFVWERSVAGLPYPQRMWEKTVRLASWAGVKPKANQTPQEYIRDVAKLAPHVDDTNVLADEYGRSRFGKASIGTDEQRKLREVWEPLRNKLVARILRWK